MIEESLVFFKDKILVGKKSCFYISILNNKRVNVSNKVYKLAEILCLTESLSKNTLLSVFVLCDDGNLDAFYVWIDREKNAASEFTKKILNNFSIKE